MDVFHYLFRISYLTKRKRFKKTIQIYVGMMNDLIDRRNVEG